jgi:hypothetical protein
MRQRYVLGSFPMVNDDGTGPDSSCYGSGPQPYGNSGDDGPRSIEPFGLKCRNVSTKTGGVRPGWTQRDAAEYRSSMQTLRELGRVHVFVTAERPSFALFATL